MGPQEQNRPPLPLGTGGSVLQPGSDWQPSEPCHHVGAEAEPSSLYALPPTIFPGNVGHSDLPRQLEKEDSSPIPAWQAVLKSPGMAACVPPRSEVTYVTENRRQPQGHKIPYLPAVGDRSSLCC